MISVSYFFEISVNIICNVTSLEGQHNYRPLTKLRKGNVFTPVCQSFCSQGGVCLSACWDTHPPGQTHPPVPSACWDRLGYCCGRYASYWNAFLFSRNFEISVSVEIRCFFFVFFMFFVLSVVKLLCVWVG